MPLPTTPMPSTCVVCNDTLMCRVVHVEPANGNDYQGQQQMGSQPGGLVPSFWKNDWTTNVWQLPDNEFVEKIWCVNCHLSYHVE